VKNSGVIIGTSVKLRAEASATSKILASLNDGTYVQILKTNVDAQWHQVKYNGKTGYINRMYICLDSSLDGYKLDYVATIVNCKNDVNVRTEPSKDSKLAGVVKKGEKLTIVPQDTPPNGWYQVDYKGETAYIHASYLDIEAKADDTQLTNLSVSGGSLYPSFSPKEYGYVIKTSSSSVTISAKANSGVKVDINKTGKSKVAVTIPSAGMKTVRITINGKIRYSLYISRNILTVGTWNIKRGYKNLLMQGRLVYDQQPDIMGIQESFQNLKISNVIDNLASLKTRGMPYNVLSPTINYSGGGQYGNGIISRYKLSGVKTYKLNSGGYEPRLLQKAVITIGGKKVSFYNTHLTYNTAAMRAKQFAQIKKIMDADTNKYKMLTGDFNADYKEFALFLKNYTVVNSVDTKYYDYAKKEINYNEIDNIILTKNIKVVNTRIVVTKLSDHCPVFAYLLLN
jgi:endonuclease/exonuclease/phosphatase family metal-dependent hydrolase/uncharacterized protein YgiM (DUF1202 family)